MLRKPNKTPKESFLNCLLSWFVQDLDLWSSGVFFSSFGNNLLNFTMHKHNKRYFYKLYNILHLTFSYKHNTSIKEALPEPISLN